VGFESHLRHNVKALQTSRKFRIQKKAPDTSIGGDGSSRLTEGILQSFCGLVLHVGQYVGVGIEGYCYGGVA
jgi:hypothetical protein